MTYKTPLVFASMLFMIAFSFNPILADDPRGPAVDLPTIAFHPDPPWWWWHDLIVPPAPPNAVPVPAGGALIAGFADIGVGGPWTLEFEIENPGGGPAFPGGVLFVAAPVGGGWGPFIIPPLAAGACFNIAMPSPPHDAPELVWAEPLGMEMGAYIITYINGTPFALGVDGGIAEKAPPADSLLTPFDFDENFEFPDTAIVIQIESGHRVPTLSHELLIALILVLIGITIWVLRRKNRLIQQSH
jgi:hypothetical protein